MPKPDDGLRALIRSHLKQVHWVSVESPITGGGIPDLNGCHENLEWWVECKFTNAWTVTFKPSQIAWISRRVRAGGDVWIAVRRRHAEGPRFGPPVDQLWLVHGRHVVELAQSGLCVKDAAGIWDGGPGRWNWKSVLSVLKGELEYAI